MEKWAVGKRCEGVKDPEREDGLGVRRERGEEEAGIEHQVRGRSLS